MSLRVVLMAASMLLGVCTLGNADRPRFEPLSAPRPRMRRHFAGEGPCAACHRPRANCGPAPRHAAGHAGACPRYRRALKMDPGDEHRDGLEAHEQFRAGGEHGMLDAPGPAPVSVQVELVEAS